MNNVRRTHTPFLYSHLRIALIVMAATAANFLPAAANAGGPAGTTITYQGFLRQAGTAFDGLIDLEFRLFNSETGGTQVGATVLQTVTVSDGLFISQLDFGLNPYIISQPLWLEIVADSTTLARQQITAAPFSLATRGITVNASGNVGIQTVSAAAALTVGDGVEVADIVVRNGGLCLDSDGACNSAGPGSLRVGPGGIHGTDSGSQHLHLVPIAGNVGIGTTDPQERLSVDGDASVTGTLDVRNGTFEVRNDGRIAVAGGTGNAQIMIRHTDPNANTCLLSFTSRDNGRAISGTTQSTSGEPVGVSGAATNLGDGVRGTTSSTFVNSGVSGESFASSGINYGVSGSSNSPNGFGVFSFDRLGATGTKSLVIDHPLDPENKFLHYYCTEGPAPLNTITGNVVLNGSGRAVVIVPDHFESIGRDFRYQLTAIGAPAPDLHVASKVQNGTFEIAGGAAGLEVSWRIDATRNDAFVRAYGAPVQSQKPDELKGKYLSPELHGAASEAAIHYRQPSNDVDADASGAEAQ